ncbi:putative zinc finger and BTB domain-containing protein 17, partial [Apostichopus japonicus]
MHTWMVTLVSMVTKFQNTSGSSDREPYVYTSMQVCSEAGREKLNCRFCSATFSRRSSRSYHERRHRNDAPYVCPKPGCNKSFVAVIDFKRHLIYHTGAKLYRCRYCSNCFTRSDYLKGHERRHHLRGEQIVAGPPVEETVTIKVPWPMEKPVKIQGQNVVVIIEPDPTLAAGELTTEALAALERAAEGHVISQDGMHLQMPADQTQSHPVGIRRTKTLTKHAVRDTTASQLLQLAAEQVAATTSAAAAEMHQSEGEIVTTSIPQGTLDSSQILMQATQQALLHQTISAEGAHISMSSEDGSQITMDAATSEQAALVLQQLAGENAQ